MTGPLQPSWLSLPSAAGAAGAYVLSQFIAGVARGSATFLDFHCLQLLVQQRLILCFHGHHGGAAAHFLAALPSVAATAAKAHVIEGHVVVNEGDISVLLRKNAQHKTKQGTMVWPWAMRS